MRTMLLFLITTAPALASTTQHTSTKQRAEHVNFCDVLNKAGQYHGKTVEVSGTLATSIEGNSFFDDGCGEATATFSSKETDTATASTKITQFLKKHKTSEARITVIAVFRDDHSLGIVEAGVPPYSFEVKKLLAISKVKPQRKHRPTKKTELVPYRAYP